MPEQTPRPLFHALTADAALAATQSGPQGIDDSEVIRRRNEHGSNVLPSPPRRHPVLRFLAHFHNVLIYVLIGSAVITAALGHWVDTGIILAVVLINAIIGFVQEGRAEEAMEAIRSMLAPRCAVLRNGQRVSIGAAELVPGDIVLVEAGDRVAADLRLLEARGLMVEEAVLTGESVPVHKRIDPVAADAALGDRTSMLFSGTLIAAGTGRGVVVATGPATQIGRISGMLAKVQMLVTPLVRQMNIFARWLTAFILLVAVSLLLWGQFVNPMPFADLFMAVVGLSVAAIPEGLPAVLTITLAVGVRVMARRNAIVRRLPAIETLGSVSVICSDKTGTLTRNEMMAATLAAGGELFTIEGDGYAPVGAVRLGGEEAGSPAHAEFSEAALAAGLCNDAVLQSAAAGWRVEGDPMEGALLALAGKLSGSGHAGFPDWRRSDAIPFNAEHRYMAVLHHDHAGHARIDVKGAPEVLLGLCTNQLTAAGDTQPLDTAYWHAMVEQLAAQGQRVIALAMCTVTQEHMVLNATDLDGQLTLIGLVGLIDPPRPEAIAAVAECHAAGIRVKMITGDHAATARAIAAHIGLRNAEQVLTGKDLDSLDEAALAACVVDVDIFARTSPSHKLRLVSALQAHGLTVAMTGDGVNDAPALKRADAGIAMGHKGSEAAKEAAELVLADDNFASIAAAVREGRTVYDNLRKVISWTLPTNAGEALTIVVALFAGLALPITAAQILWVNLVTSITLGLALAFEPSEPGTMHRPPRPRNEPLLQRELVWRIIVVSSLFLLAVFGIYRYALASGHPPALAQTLALNTLVVLEIFNLFVVRNIHGTSLTWAALRGTPVIWACIIVVTAAQFAMTYAPPLQAVFGTQAVPLADGLLVIAIGGVFFAIVEVEKQIRLRFFSEAAAAPGVN